MGSSITQLTQPDPNKHSTEIERALFIGQSSDVYEIASYVTRNNSLLPSKFLYCLRIQRVYLGKFEEKIVKMRLS